MSKKRIVAGSKTSGARGASPAGAAKAATSGAKPKAPATSEFSSVRALAAIAVEFDLAALVVEPSGRIKIVRHATGVEPSASSVALRASRGPIASHAEPAPTPVPVADGFIITSPFVGTFYLAASPDSPLFTEVGQTVRKGQPVCIIEAMKLMNEIESDVDGKVLEVLAKNADHVEYGQPLFRIQKA